ncbi:hypothetical protein FACS1894202_07930 [Clostridia bacterium]|nr:hypothetical protein FACS1894202_07930 [Clostridia bacterium]
MGQIFEFLIYKPFSWLLLQFYGLTHSYVFAIVLFALVVKVALLYFMARGKLGTLRTQRLQPKLQALQKQYGTDKEKLNAETMKMYQQEGASPMSGCLWMLLPLPVLIALYSVIRDPLTRLMNFPGNSKDVAASVIDFFTSKGIEFPATKAADAYAQMNLAQVVHNNFDAVNAAFGGALRDIDFMFAGMNMSQIPQFGLNPMVLIPLISGITAYLSFMVSTKMSRMPQTSQTKMMGFVSPAISLWFGFTMPAAMSIYWTANNVLGIAQEYFLTKHFNKVLDEEDAKKAELAERRRIAEEKQREEDRIARAEKIAAQKNHTGKYKVKKKPGK